MVTLKRQHKLKQLFIFLVVFITQAVFGQTKPLYTGYFVDGATNEKSSFKYSKIYQQTGDTFVTIYHIFHPIQGYNYLDITATHYKSEKRVTVSVDDVSVKIGGHISTQNKTYEIPSTDWFGIRGSFQSQFDAQGILPNDLAVQFVSKKFENLNIINIAKGGDDGSGATKWYILDKKY